MDRYVTGAVIRRLREKKKLTQEELASKVLRANRLIDLVMIMSMFPAWQL